MLEWFTITPYKKKPVSRIPMVHTKKNIVTPEKQIVEEQYDWDTMVSDTRQESYLDEFISELTPVDTPNALNVIRFQQELAMVLSACRTEFGAGMGYLFLVEDLASYRLRKGNKDACMPIKPQEPSIPEGNSSGEWKRYEYKQAAWIEWDKVQAGAVQAIQAKFPTMLAEDKNCTYKWLPVDVTLRQALNKIQNQVLTKKKPRELYLGVMQEIMALKYKPNSIGPTVYFQELVDLQVQANQLKQAGIGNDMIMTQALVAFRKSGNDKSLISNIEEEWDSEVMKHTNKEARLKAFIKFWTIKLAAVYSEEKGTHQAKLSERLTSLERAYKLDEQDHGQPRRTH